jgi:hypothetical protein
LSAEALQQDAVSPVPEAALFPGDAEGAPEDFAAPVPGPGESAPGAGLLTASPVIISGQDMCPDLLVNRITAEGHMVLRSFIGCYNGLYALYHGKVTMSASHLWDSETDTYNYPFIRRLLPGLPVGVLRLAGRHNSPVKSIFSYISSAEFRRDMETMGGYDCPRPAATRSFSPTGNKLRMFVHGLHLFSQTTRAFDLATLILPVSSLLFTENRKRTTNTL